MPTAKKVTTMLVTASAVNCSIFYTVTILLR